MATDVERLVVSLEASITKYERAMQKALGQTNTTMRRIEQRSATAAQRVSAGFTAMGRSVAAGFATVAALRGAQQLVDASTRIENSLKVAGLAGEELSMVYDQLFDSAQRNAAPLESLVTLYGRAALVQRELGVSTKELLNFTDNVSVALRVAGTDAQTASGALLQLSQALGSGVVRAEEFNSIQEGAQPILQAVAAGLKEAGGSVATLRKLVIDGKVSSEAFFRAFEAGSVVLQEKVANAELTVSQQFVRLQNVLIDVAGKFDDATGASNRVGAGLNNLATFIDRVGTVIAANKENIGWLIDKLGEGVASLPVVNTFLRSLDQLNLAFDVELQTESARRDAERFASETEAMFAEAISAATMMLDEWRAGWGETLPPELQVSVDDLIAKVREGGEEAKTAQSALKELGGTDTPFAEALGHLNTLVAELQRVRGEANATAVAVANAARPDVSGLPQSYAGQEGAGPVKIAPKPVSLEDYDIPAGTGSGRGGGKSGADRFTDALRTQQQRIDALNRETELQRQLGIAVNDYGFAMERLRAQIELENAAKEAGLPLDEDRIQQIDELASGYGRATAEAARLAEAQDRAKQSADDLANAGRNALDTIVDGFLEGRDAGEVLQSVVKDLTRSLITMGLNAIGGGLFGGGRGIFGFAAGGYTGNGDTNEPAGIVHRGEYVFSKRRTEQLGVANLERLHRGYAIGGIVGMPRPMIGAAGGSDRPVRILLEVQEGAAFTTRVLEVSGPASAEIAGRTVKSYDADLGTRSAEKQARFG